MAGGGNKYLDHDVSDESDLDRGYDSEVAEISKVGRSRVADRGTKRRKFSQSDSEDSKEDEEQHDAEEPQGELDEDESEEEIEEDFKIKSASWAVENPSQSTSRTSDSRAESKSDKLKPKPVKKGKEKKPGVVYLSSLPPYLKPSSLRTMLEQRGFEPITRLFLTPASKAKSTSKKNSRQLYSEGWIEFGSKKTAKLCAETLNAMPVGGKKGGFYYDDLWNMKYLKGMGWSELMAGVREERREEEGRRDEERRMIARETKRFIEGVEEGRRVSGMKRKRKEKGKDGTGDGDTNAEADGDIKRTWRQFQVQGGPSRSDQKKRKDDGIGDDVKQVLSKIF